MQGSPRDGRFPTLFGSVARGRYRALLSDLQASQWVSRWQKARESMSETPTPKHALLTLEEAASIARAPIGSIRHWCATGRLASIRPGRRRLVKRADLATLLGCDPREIGG